MEKTFVLPPPEALERIRAKHNLRLILLHGSRVTGEVHLESDIDIAVLAEKPSDQPNLIDLYADFHDAFRTDRIDLTDLTHADPLLLFAVTKTSSLLAGSKADYEQLVRKAFYRYADYKFFLDQEHSFVLSQLETYVSA